MTRLFQKQPFGCEDGLPEDPDITSYREVLKQLMHLEGDAQQAKRASGSNGPLRSIREAVRNKGELSRALGATPSAGETMSLTQ